MMAARSVAAWVALAARSVVMCWARVLVRGCFRVGIITVAPGLRVFRVGGRGGGAGPVVVFQSGNKILLSGFWV